MSSGAATSPGNQGGVMDCRRIDTGAGLVGPGAAWRARGRWRRWLARAGTLCALLATAFAHADAAAPTACPPPPAQPTAEQITAAATSQARDRGVLWRITKDGRTSHLYGSIHVGRLEWAFYGPRMSTALAASDVLALELDVTDPTLAARTQAATAALPPPPALAPDVQARLRRQWDAQCVPAAGIAELEKLHPMLQLSTLTLLVARLDGLELGYGQEFVLAGLAQRFQRPIVSLETPELQIAALAGVEPAKVGDAVAESLAQVEDGRARRVLQRLAAAWENGDMPGLEAYESWCECVPDEESRAYMRKINDDRNVHIAAGIERLHGEGKRVFAAVGVLHMSGEKALPTLLAGLGFQVERVDYTAAPVPAPAAPVQAEPAPAAPAAAMR